MVEGEAQTPSNDDYTSSTTREIQKGVTYESDMGVVLWNGNISMKKRVEWWEEGGTEGFTGDPISCRRLSCATMAAWPSLICCLARHRSP